MKIVHLSRCYWPSIGGVETHLLNLNKLLSNHDLTVITERLGSNLKLTEVHEGVLIKRLPISETSRGWKYKISVWAGMLAYLKLLLQADVIQVHDVFWWLIPFWPILFFKKIFMTFHGHEGSFNPTARQVFWHWLAAKLTRGNICVGNFHQRWYHVQPTLITYGAVQNNSLTQTLIKKSTRKNVIYVGRLADDNGILDYLAAVKILRQRHFQIRLDIYGDGPLRTAGEQLVKKEQLDVKFFGFVDQSKIHYEQYQLAFGSRYLAILEALAAGTPVVAHYNNQIKHDYLSRSPFAKWIKIVADSNQIADAVQNQTQLSENATVWAQQQTWQKLAGLYEQLWQL